MWKAGLMMLLATMSSSAKALTPNQVFDKVKDSVVVVKTLDASGTLIRQGSGVILPTGRIATNCHVVKNGASFFVGGGKQFVTASVWGGDEKKDICLLATVGLIGKPVDLGQASGLKVGDPVYAVGAPQGLELSLSDGIVAQLRGGSPPVIQSTAAISPGSSGGGLFDLEGKLVGLTTLFIEAGQSLNFAGPVEWVGDIQQGMKPARRNSSERTEARSVVDWKKRITALEAAKNWIEMKDLARRWTKAQPEESTAWMNLGNAYSELKRFPDAIDAYQQMVRIDPDDVNGHIFLTLTYAEAGNRKAALKELEQVRRIDPTEANKLSNTVKTVALENVHAASGWVKVGADKSDTQYANPSSVRRKEEMVTMWDLLDFKNAQAHIKSIKPFISIKSQTEYDCEGERQRILSSSWHSGHMGRGDVVLTESHSTSWHSIAPESRGERLWQVACGKGR